MAFYKQSKERFDTEPEFKARAYSCVVKLQAHDEARGNRLEIHQPTTIWKNIFFFSFLLLSPGFRIRIDLMRIRIRIRIQHFF